MVVVKGGGCPAWRAEEGEGKAKMDEEQGEPDISA